MEKFLKIGAILAFIAVALGAFAAHDHALKRDLHAGGQRLDGLRAAVMPGIGELDRHGDLYQGQARGPAPRLRHREFPRNRSTISADRGPYAPSPPWRIPL